MKAWVLDSNIFLFLILMTLIGIIVCLPLVLFAKRFGHFFFVILFFLGVIGLLETGYANVFMYHYGKTIQMDDPTFLRFALGGFALILGLALDAITIIIMGANVELRGDTGRETFLDKMDRIHEDDARREHIEYSREPTPRWERVPRSKK